MSRLPGNDYPVEITEAGLFPGQTLISYGKAAKVDTNNSALIIPGWISESTKKETGKYPAIIGNEYGTGKALFYAFDLGMSIKDDNYTQIKEILKGSLNYVHRPALENASYLPFDLVPLRTEVRSLGGAFDLRITESYPSDVRLLDGLTGEWITENPWTKETNLNANETREIGLFALTPDAKGTYAIKTDVDYSEDGSYKSFWSQTAEIKVEKDSYTLINDILYKLGVIKALVIGNSLESSKVDQAERYIEIVRDRIVYTREEAEMNVHEMLKAIDALSAIKSIDIKEIRLDMGRLLGVYGERWYIDL